MTELSSGDQADLGRGPADGGAGTDRQHKNDRQRGNDRSPWNWLLVIPIVIPLLVPLYNRVEPTLFGWPFFYWGQLFAFIALGVITTSIVYQKTKTRRSPGSDGDRSGTRPADGRGR